MIAPDANLLLYAYIPFSAFHKRAKSWLEEILSNVEPVGLTIITIHSFVRLLANPAISRTLVTLPDALAIVDQWLALPHVRILYPDDQHWDLLKRTAIDGQATGNLVPDAVLAAIAAEYGAVIHTNDRDFARFPGLRWHNPLQP